jgi:hypothetical protein
MRYQTDQYNRIVLQGLEYDRYQAFSDDEKASIRKHFRWNRKYKKWVSRDNNSATVQAIEKLGFKPESGKAELAPAPRRQSSKGSRKGKASAPDTGLTFAQHLAAWEVLHENDALDKSYMSVTRKTYINQFGTVIVKKSVVRNDNDVDRYNLPRKQDFYKAINKAGTVGDYNPEWRNQKMKNLYLFEGGIYGVEMEKKPGWFRPSNKTGTTKFYVNGKQVKAASAKLRAAGMESGRP